jgi:hypothetical protein
VAIIAVEIGVTDTNLVATATTIIAARILEIYALFARNHIIVYKSILKRNKMLKKPNSSLKTLADSILNRLLLASVLIRVISNILLVLRVISTITTT